MGSDPAEDLETIVVAFENSTGNSISVDLSGDDPAALSLVAEPVNPNGKRVHDLALEQVSIGKTRSRMA